MTAAIESNAGGGGGGAVKPALGLTWADLVTTRLLLTRPEGVDASEDFQKVNTHVKDTLGPPPILSF